MRHVGRPLAAILLTFATAFGLMAPAAGASATTATTGAGTIAGTVLAADGASIASEVRVYRGDDPYVVGATNAAAGTGAYAVSGLAPGTYRVLFINKSGSAHRSEWWENAEVRAASTPVTVEADLTVTLDARLELGGEITGVITSADGPVADVDVRLSGGPTAVYQLPRRTDAAGRYSYQGLAAGQYTMTFTPPSRWSAVDHNGAAIGTSPSGDPVSVSSGGVTRVDLTVRRSNAIEGTATVLRDGTSVPFVGKAIATRLETGTAGTGGTFAEVATDAAGRYSLTGLAAGDWTVRFDYGPSDVLPQYWGGATKAADADVVSVGEGEVVTGIDTELGLGARYRTVVTYPDGEVSRETVFIEAYRFDEESGVYTQEAFTSTYSGWPVVSGLLPPGRYAIYAYVGYRNDIGGEFWRDARYFADRTDIELEAGATVDLGPIELEPRYFDVGRIAAADRFATAVEVSKATLPDGGAPIVYIANGLNYPDVLAAGPAASLRGGVLLLVRPDAIPAVVEAELRRLDPDRIVVAGGTGAVSSAVYDRLRAHVDTPDALMRLGGPDRYSTAEIIVREAFEDVGSRYAYIATGRNFPDALAAGPAAARKDAPVILVDGLANSAAEWTTDLLTDLGVTELSFAGGSGVLRDPLRYSLVSTPGVTGFSHADGADRFEVARQLNGGQVNSDVAFIANGYGFADALAGGPLAAANGAAMFLARPDCVPQSTVVGLLDGRAAGVVLIGGDGALSRSVEDLQVC